MPTPGSNKYDREKHRLQRHLEREGHFDDDAAQLASDAMSDEANGVSPAATSDRARGPYGERGGGGDAGNVIDLRSPSFNENTIIPPRHTSDGDNTSPPLEWSAPPDDAVELALVCEDPDAPTGTFTHWLVTGISPDRRSLDEGREPGGVIDWPNGFGHRSYDGPNPPTGDEPHRYFFRLYALDAPVDADPETDIDAVRAFLDEHRVATGTLVGLYAR